MLKALGIKTHSFWSQNPWVLRGHIVAFLVWVVSPIFSEALMDNKGAPKRRLFWVTSNAQALQITDLGQQCDSLPFRPQSGPQHIRQMIYVYDCICDLVPICI